MLDSIGANSSVSKPLLITVIVSLEQPNSSIMPFFELFEGRDNIFYIWGNFFCIFKMSTTISRYSIFYFF